jgi:hypothetical protein
MSNRKSAFSMSSSITIPVSASRSLRRLTSLLLACAAAAISVEAQSFSPPTRYDVGDNPNFGIVGDFNRDGKPDLAVSAAQSNNVCILINKGDGTFQNPVFYLTDFNAEGVATGDFNKDGKLDLAVANVNGGSLSTGNIRVLLGNGDGTFQSAGKFDSPGPSYLKTADLNADGNLDLVASAYQANGVAVLLGNGDGTFRAAVTYSVGSQATDVAVADFNSDGKPDLAVGGYYAGLFIMLGNGDGSFQAPASLTSQRTFGLAVGDLNGDSKADIVAAGSAIFVFLGNGNGTFQSQVTYPVGSEPQKPDLGDFNGDGKVDIIVVNALSSDLSVLRGNGDGTFQPANTSPVRMNSYTSAVGDLNSDGKPDLVIMDNGFDLVDVRLNSPSPHSAAINATATVPATSVTVATFIDYDKTKPAASYTVNINWGDGTAGTPGTVSLSSTGSDSNSFNVNGTHTFAKEGPYNVSVQIADTLGNFAAVTSVATVADAPLTSTGKSINAIRGAAFTEVLASFSDADPTGQVSDFSAIVDWGDGTSTSTGTVTAHTGGGFDVTGTHTYLNTGSFSVSVTIVDNGGSFTTAIGSATVTPPVIEFSQSSYAANEADGSVQITVMRTGSSANPTTVNFATSDNTAKEKNDYTTAIGTLSFSTGQASRTFTVLLTNNVFVDGDRVVTLTLSSPSGAVLGARATALLTIHDNDLTPPTTNPLDDAQFFVRQHYADFLNREADSGGLSFWTNNITGCTPQPSCIEIQRINTSAAFFISIEFQDTGYVVYRMYKTAYGDGTGTSTLGGSHQISIPIIRRNEFLPDTQRIGQGVVVGQGNWQQQLDNNKQSFADEFVQRPRFLTAYPLSLTPAQFVDGLNTKAGGVLTPAQRDQLVSELTATTRTRAQVLRAVAENQILYNAEYNRAFVLMQYFGYLRRNPNDPPDSDYTGYDFWLSKLNQFNGNYVVADMVKAFLSASEYRQRFGP